MEVTKALQVRQRQVVDFLGLPNSKQDSEAANQPG